MGTSSPLPNYEQFHREFNQKQGTTSIDSNVGQISAQMPFKLSDFTLFRLNFAKQIIKSSLSLAILSICTLCTNFRPVSAKILVCSTISVY